MRLTVTEECVGEVGEFIGTFNYELDKVMIAE